MDFVGLIGDKFLSLSGFLIAVFTAFVWNFPETTSISVNEDSNEAWVYVNVEENSFIGFGKIKRGSHVVQQQLMSQNIIVKQK